MGKKSRGSRLIGWVGGGRRRVNRVDGGENRRIIRVCRRGREGWKLG